MVTISFNCHWDHHLIFCHHLRKHHLALSLKTPLINHNNKKQLHKNKKATSCSGAVLLGRVGCLLPAPIVPIPHPKPPLGPRRAHQLTHIRALPTRPLGLPAGIAHYQKNTSGHPEWKVKYSSTLASVHSITVNIAKYCAYHLLADFYAKHLKCLA